MFDVAIVGAGPAGAMLAKLVGEDYRVLLVDRRPLDKPPVSGRPDKCCGGMLSENAQNALKNLGITVPSSVKSVNKPTEVRVIDKDNNVERIFAKPYINCNRELLDRWLVSLAPAKVDIRCSCSLREVEIDNTGATLTLSADGRTHTERARLLVGADGANSLVRRQLFPKAAIPRKYIAVQGWYEADLPYHLAVYDRAVTDYYGWAVSKDGLLAIGAAFVPHADLQRHYKRLISSVASIGINPGCCIRLEGALINRPMHLKEICLGNEQAVLLGEAAGLISPTSAEGFSYAFRSASALAEAMKAGPGNSAKNYRTRTRPLCRAICKEIFKCSGMFTPWIRGLVLHSMGATVVKSSSDIYQQQALLSHSGH